MLSNSRIFAPKKGQITDYGSVTFKPIFHSDAKYLALALGNAPDARILRWRYQHVGLFWRYLTLKFALAPTQNLKFALALMPSLDGSQ